MLHQHFLVQIRCRFNAHFTTGFSYLKNISGDSHIEKHLGCRPKSGIWCTLSPSMDVSSITGLSSLLSDTTSLKIIGEIQSMEMINTHIQHLYFNHDAQYPFSILCLTTQIQMDIVYKKNDFKCEMNNHLICFEKNDKYVFKC